MPLFGEAAPTILFATANVSTQVVSFERADQSLNAVGEISQVFSSVVVVAVSLQPSEGVFDRFRQGQIEKRDYVGIIQGNVPLWDGDRVCALSSLLEITNVAHWGQRQTELFLKGVR